MDFVPIGLAFVSGLTGGIIVLHQLFQNPAPVESDAVKFSSKTSANRGPTRDALSHEMSATITNQLNNVEQQVSMSLRPARFPPQPQHLMTATDSATNLCHSLKNLIID